jgi:hypothetical protein
MISLTTPELAVVCDYLDAGLPPRAAAEWNGMDSESRRLALDIAERSLVQRGLMSNGSLDPDLVAVVAALIRPTLIVVAQAWRRGVPPVVGSYSISPELSVAYRFAGGFHLLQVIDSGDLIPALVAGSGSDEGIGSDAVSIAIPEQVLAGWLVRPDVPVTTESPEVVSLLDAISGGAVYRSVAMAHRPSSGRVAGGELSWIEHAAGRWLVGRQAGSDRIDLSPVTGEALIDELRSFLPEGPHVG